MPADESRALLPHAARPRGLGPVVAVLLLAVLAPTACVVWFMAAAMRSERLAVRQRLIDVYRDRGQTAGKALEAFWSQREAALRRASGLPAAEGFAALVRSGLVDAAAAYDEAGGTVYPAESPAAMAGADTDSPAWREAAELEREPGQAGRAAEAYAALARDANDADTRARALQAQARCLLLAGRKDDALAVLTGPLAAPALREAVDAHGRLIVPNAELLALQLTPAGREQEPRALAARLAERLNDYHTKTALSAAQRLFLMEELQRLAGGGAAPMPTLAGERLAAEYLQAQLLPVEPLRLTRAWQQGQIWHMASGDRRLVAVFRQESLLTSMRSAAGIDRPVAGADIVLSPPVVRPAGPEPLVSLPAGKPMPGWTLDVHLTGEDPIGAAAGRQIAAYFWTGILGVGAAAVLGLVAASFVGRQVRQARLKNDLIATVSHELKTPLASMRVLVDTLLAGRCRDEGQAREYFQLIARENERLSRLIDNFLTFSRMERNKRAFVMAPLQPGELVAAAAEAAGERFDAPGCRLDVEVSPGLPAIRGDRDALLTVLLNLLDNAHKYSGPDKHVVLRARAGEGGGVCLEVADNGVGLSRRAMKRVFRRFYQVDRTLSRRAGGCGLGLSIVEFIVEAHGGSVGVTSRPGEGSTFSVRLPGAGPTPGRTQEGMK